MSTISKRKQKRFHIEAYYRNESKTFLLSPLMVGTKTKHFDVVQLFNISKVGPLGFVPKIPKQSKAIRFVPEIV